MKPYILNSILALLALFGSEISIADVSTTGVKDNYSSQDWNRVSLYRLGNLYMADGSGNTLSLLAPDLADDNTIFKLPADNGSANQALIGDGAGALSYGDPLITNYLDLTHATTPSNPSSGLIRLYPKNDNVLYLLNSAGEEIAVGTGGGGGDSGYIENYNFETNVTGWTAYDDGAATPVDCTGGSPTSTFTRNDATPIKLTGSGRFAKDAADRQGEGVAADFTIDGPDENSNLAIRFPMRVSADFVANDMTVYIYARDTPQLITPEVQISGGVGLPAHTSERDVTVNWTSTGDRNYRVCFHVATTNADAYDLDLDDVVVGKPSGGTAPASHGPVDFTPSSSQGFGTLSDVNLTYSRFGKWMLIEGEFTAGTVAASEAQLGLPSGHTIYNQSATRQLAGGLVRNSVTNDIVHVLASDGQTYLRFGKTDDTAVDNPLNPVNGNDMTGSSTRMSIRAMVQIVGWDDGASLINDANSTAPGQVLLYTGNGLGSTATKIRRYTDSIVTGGTLSYSDSSTNGALVTVLQPGTYAISYCDGAAGAEEYFGISINASSLTTDISSLSFANGRRTLDRSISARSSCNSATLNLVAGDEIRPHTNGTAGNGSSSFYVTDVRVAGGSVYYSNATATNPGLVKKNTINRKVLSANRTTDGTMADLTFSVIPGMTYEIHYYFEINMTNGDSVQVNFNDSGEGGRFFRLSATNSDSVSAKDLAGGTLTKTMVGSSLTFDVSSITAGSLIAGGTLANGSSHVELKMLGNVEVGTLGN